MSSENEAPLKVVAILVIVAGVLVAGAALTKMKLDNIEAEQRNHETEREVLRLQEAERARELALEAELRRAFVAPMPRAKP